MRKNPALWKHADLTINSVSRELSKRGYLPKTSDRRVHSKRLSRGRKLVFTMEPVEVVNGANFNPTLLYVDSDLSTLKWLGDVRISKLDLSRLPFIGSNIGNIAAGTQYKPDVSSTINRFFTTRKLLSLFTQAEFIIMNYVTPEGLARLVEDEAMLARVAVNLPLSMLQIRVAILLRAGINPDRVSELIEEFERRHFDELGHANQEAFRAFQREALIVAAQSTARP